ncbi:MAG: hypothetical protein H6710_00800 [Myxococcales bacterium]|nr:hypothetical protein [Myxococcales bacterium]
MTTLPRAPSVTLRLAPLLVLALVGCARSGGETPRACTEIGCMDGLRIALEPSSGMPAGAYVIDLEIDGAATRCEGNLPLKPCEEGSSVTCSSDAVVVEESGCAMAPEAQALSGILFESARPKDVKVTIRRDGEVVAEAELSPEYRRLEPNGPGCPPICEQAEATLTLAAAAGE